MDLSTITNRVGDLKSRGNAAAAAGDFATAAYFFGLVRQAEKERQRTLERIMGNVTNIR